ncbi:hypothetical protein ASD65_04100 [Microbacterium sp. Root61]|uniref:flavodoxin family protein n=1 Tax=Microbacterium sp. Root61 TaxID=1736570 RepID=UPI0006F988FD|nr:flavodoxin domain-containing protein [Microbacterium sp. Root61]KRA23699.1 hypothetical protein ASD65_04100 [Microbacterium sp. Root61]
MSALVVYESLWGNTEKVARAIADALASHGTVAVFDSDAAPSSTDAYELLVVGAPTHAFSMSRPSTRADAVKSRSAPHEPVKGVREWLADLQRPAVRIPALVFDTRVDQPRLPGSAAKAARHELHDLGFDTSAVQETFRVHGYEGPLLDGEIERAIAWASANAAPLGARPSAA